MCGLWLACGAVRSAGAPFVRPAVLVIARVISTVRRIAPSAMTSHGCSSTSHVRYICCPVDTAQNIVSGKLARPHLIRDYHITNLFTHLLLSSFETQPITHSAVLKHYSVSFQNCLLLASPSLDLGGARIVQAAGVTCGSSAASTL